MTRDVVVLATVMCAITGATLSAQTAPQPDGRWELSIGAGLLGGADLGSRPADVRAGGSGDPFRLFEARSDLTRAGLVEARAGVSLTRRVAVEGRLALSRPELRTTISSDLEIPSIEPLAERVSQYAFDGGVRLTLYDAALFGWSPFAAGGLGYLRQLHENDALVEEGSFYYVGGGLARRLVSRRQGFVRGVGVRVDVRLHVFLEGDSLVNRSRRQGAASGSLVVAF